jgi:23S rRNA-/tRNA-specific pseudouridylate synthase
MKISPKTDFTRHIRVKLSAVGSPILNDDLYYRAVDINTKNTIAMSVRSSFS